MIREGMNIPIYILANWRRQVMKIKSKVVKFTGNRKIVEIPSAVVNNFEVGEEVIITKTRGNK